MRIIAIAVAALSIALFHRSAEAQSFWYVPPGYGYGYSQDLGNGVGFGYGIGSLYSRSCNDSVNSEFWSAS